MTNYDELIFPDTHEKICIVKAEDSKELKGYKLHSDSKVYNMIMEELKNPYFMSVIKLFQCSRNLTKNNLGPNLLYLSENEGCFPRTGIYIKEGDNYTYFPDLNYVDLVLDENRIKNGELYIYIHELAHSMIKNILPNFPQGKSTIPHFSTCMTDYFTAFDEGFAESFEHTTCCHMKNYSNIIKKKFNFENNILKHWICEFDGTLRYEGVVKNSFIYNKLMPKIDNLDVEESLLLEQTSPYFDTTSLKTGSEMLSCEGVIATIFYNIINDEVLQDSYACSDIYSKFLIKSLPDNINVRDLFSPYENIIIKILWVMHNMSSKIEEDSIVFIDFIKEWCSCFNEDKERLITIFINLTIARTIENSICSLYEEIAFAGLLGDAEKISKLLKEYKNKLKTICEKVLCGELSIDKYASKEFWVQNKNVNAPQVFFSSTDKSPMMINLNTASFRQLMSFPQMTAEAANKIIGNRKQGIFATSLPFK